MNSVLAYAVFLVIKVKMLQPQRLMDYFGEPLPWIIRIISNPLHQTPPYYWNNKYLSSSKSWEFSRTTVIVICNTTQFLNYPVATSNFENVMTFHGRNFQPRAALRWGVRFLLHKPHYFNMHCSPNITYFRRSYCECWIDKQVRNMGKTMRKNNLKFKEFLYGTYYYTYYVQCIRKSKALIHNRIKCNTIKNNAHNCST